MIDVSMSFKGFLMSFRGFQEVSEGFKEFCRKTGFQLDPVLNLEPLIQFG